MSIIESLETQWQQMQGTSSAEDFDPSKLDTTATREQEQEQEKEVEDTREREIDREAALAVSRDEEGQIPWRFCSLAQVWLLVYLTFGLQLTLHLYAKDCDQVDQFYPASRFCLYRTRPVDFPSYTMISNNYFNKDWAGNRRVKNVVMVLEWVPSASKLCWMEDSTCDLPPDRAALFARAFRYFDIWVRWSLTTTFSIDWKNDELYWLVDLHV
jgi:hypothetical protein